MTSYLDVAELNAMAAGLDTAGLGSEVDLVLARASAWADRICRLPVGALGGLPQIEMHRTRVNRDGELFLRLRGTSPTVPATVTTVSWGYTLTTLSALTALDTVDVTEGLVTIPVGIRTGSWVGALNVSAPPQGQRVLVQVGYTSGWTSDAMPPDLKQAVAFLACALIITPDADNASTPFPGAAARSDGAARAADVDYLDSAERMLGYYARRTA